jgi:hypothetical protein
MTTTTLVQLSGPAAGRSTRATHSASVANNATPLFAMLRDALSAGRASSGAGPRARVAIASDFASRVRS